MMSVDRTAKIIVNAGRATQLNTIAQITTWVFTFSCKEQDQYQLQTELDDELVSKRRLRY